MNDQPHRCERCHEPISEGERWEYYHGAPRVGEEKSAARIHARCVAALLKETLAAFARVPEDKREHIFFEI